VRRPLRPFWRLFLTSEIPMWHLFLSRNIETQRPGPDADAMEPFMRPVAASTCVMRLAPSAAAAAASPPTTAVAGNRLATTVAAAETEAEAAAEEGQLIASGGGMEDVLLVRCSDAAGVDSHQLLACGWLDGGALALYEVSGHGRHAAGTKKLWEVPRAAPALESLAFHTCDHPRAMMSAQRSQFPS
jgi:hypothetical protein